MKDIRVDEVGKVIDKLFKLGVRPVRNESRQCLIGWGRLDIRAG
jgi:hypothetical protein